MVKKGKPDKKRSVTKKKRSNSNAKIRARTSTSKRKRRHSSKKKMVPLKPANFHPKTTDHMTNANSSDDCIQCFANNIINATKHM